MPIEKKNHRNLPQVNEKIRVLKVRAVDVDGQQLGIVETREALRMAEEKGLDLVMISDKADPPVCRIIDYGKYLFEQKQHSNLAEKLLQRMAKDLKDLAEIQQAPKKEGRSMMMLLSPKK